MSESTDGTIGGIPIARIQHLLDRQDIHECLERYIRGLDRHDGELIASAFWPDAQINYGESFSGPTAEFVPWEIDIEAQYLSSHHFLSTQNVGIQGDTAHIETYLFFIVRNTDKTEGMGGGRYIDVAERRKGEWRLSQREFMAETRHNAPSLVPERPTTPQGTRGDRSDLSYQRPLKRRPESARVRVVKSGGL